MVISTASKIKLMDFFMVDGVANELAKAERVVVTGSIKRFSFADGSAIEVNKTGWKVVKMSKLEDAKRRFGGFQAGGVVKVGDMVSREQHLERKIAALQELLNKRDAQLDLATRPIHIDWWVVILVGLVIVGGATGFM